jgi:hypothetical protein
MTTFKKGQTVYYDAQENPDRPIRARVERRLKDGRYKVRALWPVDPVTGKEPEFGFLDYVYVIDAAALRATFKKEPAWAEAPGHMLKHLKKEV